MRVTIATLAILAHAGLISATDLCVQQAKSDPTPNCNAIHLPGLHDIVQGGMPYTITWGNNTGAFVSLVLCQGDSSNIKEIDCIANHTPNNGSYVWTPATDLVPDGNHNYGLKIIADTGDFQWSDQFGIANSISVSSSSTSAAASTTPTTATSGSTNESAKSTKETGSAVKQASDGQIQQPTGIFNTKTHHAKNTSITIYATGQPRTYTKNHTHTKDQVSKPFATSKQLSSQLVHHGGANATHVLSSVVAQSATGSVTPTVAPSVGITQPPTTVASPPTVLPSPVASPSTTVQAFTGAGAARAAVTGIPLVLGAIAALVL